MKVYVLTEGEYSDTKIAGVFATLDAAKGATPERTTWKEWDENSYYGREHLRWDGECAHERAATEEWWKDYPTTYTIHEHELQGFAVDELLRSAVEG